MHRLIAIALAVMLPQMAWSQVGDPRRDVAIGLNAGYSMSQVSFTPTIRQDLKADLCYGMTIRYNCEKYFKSLCGVQVEVNYVNMGWKEKIETSTDTYTRDMHYVQVPILARMGWGYEQKGALFYILAGPQIGYLISEGEKRGGEWSNATLAARPAQVIQQYGKPTDHRSDYGLTAGLGMEINTRHAGHYMIDGRYYLALGDIYKNGKRDDFGRSAFTCIYVKVSYLFDILRTKRH